MTTASQALRDAANAVLMLGSDVALRTRVAAMLLAHAAALDDEADDAARLRLALDALERENALLREELSQCG